MLRRARRVQSTRAARRHRGILGSRRPAAATRSPTRTETRTHEHPDPPPADREKAYLDALKQADWVKPVVSSATPKFAEYSGPSGVKITGP